MVNLGDLSKLLDQGNVTDEHVFKSKDGDYKFKIKTLTPLEDIDAQTAAILAMQDVKTNADDNSYNTFYALEVLARAIDTVNDVPLKDVPGASGTSEYEKRRSITAGLGEKLMIDLWKKYNDMRIAMDLDGTEEESEAVKK